MPHRFPALAPQEKQRNRAMARALPAPSVRWLDMVIFGVILALIRHL